MSVSARPRQRLMMLFAPALAFVSPIIEALGTLSIPLRSVGALVFAGGVLIVGLLLGALMAVLLPTAKSGTLRRAVFVSLLVLAVLLTIDMAAGGHALLAAAGGGRVRRLALLAVTGASLFSIVWPLTRHAAPVVFIAALTMFASTVVLNVRIFTREPPAGGVPSSGSAETDKPPVIYILLDGAMGVEGLRRAPGGQELAEELREVFLRYGFRVYGNAFSRHFVSARAIPNSLNFDFRDDSWGPLLRHHEDLKVRSRLFERLSNRGYEVVAYGTEHIDFCFDVASRCEVLPSFSPFSSYIADDERRTRWTYQVLWHAFSRSYVLYHYGSLLLTTTEDAGSSPFSALDVYAFPRWFQRFEGDVTSTPRGRAYFAHLLMPHAPYVYDASCRDVGTATVAYFLYEQHHLTGAALDDARVKGYDAYVRQYRCLLRTLNGFLARLEELETFEDATIVIHGDHGPRISAGQFFEHLSERDLIDNHSTLFAIRAPSVTSFYDDRLTSVQRLTAEYFSSDGGGLGPDVPTVVIDSREDGRVRVRPMPDMR